MSPIKINNFFSGLSGLQIPYRKDMYPPDYQQKSRLTYYSSLFNSIEINSSFYKLPRPQTILKWVEETSEDFVFTFKLWKQITHNKFLEFSEMDVYSFFESVANAGFKKACILIQLPPSCGAENYYQLARLFANVNIYNKSNEWNFAIEFRNSSWYQENVYDLAEQNNFAIVIHDMKKSSAPMLETAVKIKYIRFHGPTGNYRGTYAEDFIFEYASYIHTWLNENNKVYVYFNNTMGDAFGNLSVLNKQLLLLR